MLSGGGTLSTRAGCRSSAQGGQSEGPATRPLLPTTVPTGHTDLSVLFTAAHSFPAIWKADAPQPSMQAISCIYPQYLLLLLQCSRVCRPALPEDACHVGISGTVRSISWHCTALYFRRGWGGHGIHGAVWLRPERHAPSSTGSPSGVRSPPSAIPTTTAASTAQPDCCCHEYYYYCTPYHRPPSVPDCPTQEIQNQNDALIM